MRQTWSMSFWASPSLRCVLLTACRNTKLPAVYNSVALANQRGDVSMRSIVWILLPVGQDGLRCTPVLTHCDCTLTSWPVHSQQHVHHHPLPHTRAEARTEHGRSSTSSGSFQAGTASCSAACLAGPRAERGRMSYRGYSTHRSDSHASAGAALIHRITLTSPTLAHLMFMAD